jgi:small subunit ribosomal protein S17
MKQLQGIVVSIKMQKSAVVKVDRHYRHPLYKKTVKRSKKYLVHDEKEVKEGDKVLIQECRPMSKRKRFKIIKVINRKPINN